MCSFLSTLLHTSFLVQREFGDIFTFVVPQSMVPLTLRFVATVLFWGGFGTLNSMEMEPVTSLPEIRGSNYITIEKSWDNSSGSCHLAIENSRDNSIQILVDTENIQDRRIEKPFDKYNSRTYMTTPVTF